MTRTLIAVPLALLALAGCTSDLAGHGAPAGDAARHASARPGPTPTAMTLAQAGAKYQELVDGTNAAAYAVNQALHDYLHSPTSGGFQTLTHAEANLADAEQRFVAGLSAARWPATVQPAVDTLVTAMAPEIAGVRRLATAADPSAFAAAQDAAQKANTASSAKAAALRALLGVGGVPNISPTGP